MSNLRLILLLTLAIGILLALFIWWARHQQLKFARRARAKALIKEAEALLEALDYLIRFDNCSSIQLSLLGYLGYLKRSAERLDPLLARGFVFDASLIEQQINERKIRIVNLRSDRELHQAKRLIELILKTLNKMAKHQQLAGDELLQSRNHLRLLLLEKEVDAYREQGDKAVQQGDVLKANSFYKLAKKRMLDCDIAYPEKNEQIRQLSVRATEMANGYLKEHLEKLLPKEQKTTLSHGIPADPLKKRKF